MDEGIGWETRERKREREEINKIKRRLKWTLEWAVHNVKRKKREMETNKQRSGRQRGFLCISCLSERALLNASMCRLEIDLPLRLSAAHTAMQHEVIFFPFFRLILKNILKQKIFLFAYKKKEIKTN